MLRGSKIWSEIWDWLEAGLIEDFTGKTILVTGAAGDIGAEIAQRFIRRGAHVHVSDIGEQELSDRVQQLSRLGEVTASIGDLANLTFVKTLAEDAMRRGGKVDVLVNNAAVQAEGDLDDCSLELFDQAYAINVRAPFLLAKYLVPSMRSAGGGAIVNISSVHATSPGPARLAYATSKTALLGMTRALAVDLGRDNIRVNVVSPGATLTSQLKSSWQNKDLGVDVMAHVKAQHPLGRIAEVSDIAEAVAYLAAAKFVSGTELRVDGGLLAALRLLPPREPEAGTP